MVLVMVLVVLVLVDVVLAVIAAQRGMEGCVGVRGAVPKLTGCRCTPNGIFIWFSRSRLAGQW